jgi:hypothetical protein
MTEIRVHLQHGRQAYSDGSGGVTGGVVVEGPTRTVFNWKGIPEEDRPTFIAGALRTIEKRHDIERWYHDGHRLTSEKPKPSSKPKSPGDEVWSLCPVTVTGELWGTSHICSRPVPHGETRCGVHRAAAKRRADNDAERRARWAEKDAQRERDKARTDDLRALWAECCDRYGVEPERAGRVWIDGTTAHVDDEVLIRFLRTLIERS